MNLRMKVLTFAGVFAAAAGGALVPRDYQTVLENITQVMHERYNMSVALALYSENPKVLSSQSQSRTTYNVAAAGYTDAGLGMGVPTRLAQPATTCMSGAV